MNASFFIFDLQSYHMEKAPIFKIGKKKQDDKAPDTEPPNSFFSNIIPQESICTKKLKKRLKSSFQSQDDQKIQHPFNNIVDIKKQLSFNRSFKQLNQKFKQQQMKRKFYENFPFIIKSYSQGQSISKQQFDNEEQETQSTFSFIQNHKFIYLFLQLSILALRIILIWLSSMHVTFELIGLQYLYCFMIALIIVQTLLAYQRYKSKHPKTTENKLGFFILFVKNSYVIFYSVLCQFSFKEHSIAFLLLDLLFIYIQQSKCIQNYQVIKRILISSFLLSRPIKLAEMIITILVVGHFFSVCLYLITYLNQEKNWTTEIQDSLDTWIDRYAYSLYFTYSTMLTVGYGDLTPTNKYQILVILFTQIFGVVVFAFIVNEIGSTLSDMRKQSDSIEQDIGMIERLSKYYDLSRNLTFKTRQYILTHGKQFIQQSNYDQNRLMNKLNENLRKAIINETNTKLISKSIFFLCNWTKDFRREIAYFIIKTIIPPNQKIYQIEGKQKIYIVQKGKFSVALQRRQQNKVYFKKTIKNVTIDPKKQILNNTFGYVCTLTQRPINIIMDTISFVVAYTIDTEKFIQVIRQNRCNYEYFIELKTKVLQKHIPQSFQVPQVQNFRQHYIPNRYILIKKNRKIEMDQKRKQRYCRERQKRKLIYYTQQLLENDYQLNQITNLVSKQRQINFVRQFEIMRSFTNFYAKYNPTQIIDQLKSKYYTVNMDGNFVG